MSLYARDSSYPTHPEEFLPERFMGIQNFQSLPFGGGRRNCPGMNVGIVMMKLVLANLLPI